MPTAGSPGAEVGTTPRELTAEWSSISQFNVEVLFLEMNRFLNLKWTKGGQFAPI